MPVNLYECLILLDSTKVAGQLDEARGMLQTTMEKYQAEILISRVWDERRLTYPIQNQKKGLYYLIYARIESLKVKDIEADFRIVETILRFMVVKIDAKWEETMLTVGRDERTLAYHAMIDDSDGTDPMAGMGDDGPPRRGGRRQSNDSDMKD